jgi:hypothetical protein
LAEPRLEKVEELSRRGSNVTRFVQRPTDEWAPRDKVPELALHRAASHRLAIYLELVGTLGLERACLVAV